MSDSGKGDSGFGTNGAKQGDLSVETTRMAMLANMVLATRDGPNGLWKLTERGRQQESRREHFRW